MNNSSQDVRKFDLVNWARQQISDQPLAGLEPEFSVVSGDASFRRYFRLSYRGADFNESFILVDAPPAHENCAAFVAVAKLFRQAGMATPQVLAVDYDQGFMLLEDFGDQLYLPVLQRGLAAEATDAAKDDAECLYELAINALIKLQKNASTNELARYDRALLSREMGLFEEWFCGRLLQQDLNEEDRVLIATTLRLLEDEALAQPVVAVHRDYHSRNLMIPASASGITNQLNNQQAAKTPAVIDFQDAVAGPYTYDLISLLRDCYIKWPRERVYARAMRYLQSARQAKIIPSSIDDESFRRQLDLMGLQRHLKVLGIFSRLCIRDNKPQYLSDLPLVIEYTLEVADQYPELVDFSNWFRRKLMPVVRKRLAAQYQSGTVAN